MKQKIIKTDKATVLVVEVSEVTRNVVLFGDDEIGYYADGINKYTKLPKGNWQLLGRLPEMTQEQSFSIVDSYEVSHNIDLTVTLAFKDYVNGIECDDPENCDCDYWDEYPFDSPLDSLSSLLQANGFLFDAGNTYIPYELGSMSATEHLERTLDVLDRKSKVWDKERCYLFIKVDLFYCKEWNNVGYICEEQCYSCGKTNDFKL